MAETHDTPMMDPMRRVIESAKKELERMLDLLPLGMMLVDRIGRVIRLNRALLRMTGQAQFSDVIGRFYWELFPAPAGSSEGADRGWMCDILIPDEVRRLDVVGTTALNPGPRQLCFTLIPAHDLTRRAVVEVEDVTDIHAEELAKEKETGVRATHAIVGGLKHHVNQPLMVIMATAYLIAQEVQRPHANLSMIQQHADEIVRMVDRIAHLIDKAASLDEFETETYYRGDDIVKLDPSS